MPNSSGSNKRQLRMTMNRPRCRRGRTSAMATPEIRNSNDMRQPFSSRIGHCSASVVKLPFRWKPQSPTYAMPV